ncbi:hypothetical protein MferCBS31731_001915 [Microsporum ferrugineum]
MAERSQVYDDDEMSVALPDTPDNSPSEEEESEENMESGSDKEESDVEMDDRFTPGGGERNEAAYVDGWDEDAIYALAIQYRRHKKKFWTKIGEQLGFPWREVERMHFEIGKEGLSSRANEASRNPTTSDRIMEVLKEIDYFRSIFYNDMDEPREPLTYPRLLDALAGISISTTALIAQIEASPGPWSPRIIGLMEGMVHDLWILVSDELAGADWNPNMGPW